MSKIKDQLIEKIMLDARQKLGKLSIEFARAESEDKEDILAEMEFHRFMEETCRLCLDD
jgi:hypothetical protein